MPISASAPTTLAVIYDKWAFRFHTSGFGLALPGAAAPVDRVGAHVTLVKYRERDDGVGEMSPLDSDRAEVDVSDLYALAETDPVVAEAMVKLIEAVAHIAQLQGKL